MSLGVNIDETKYEHDTNLGSYRMNNLRMFSSLSSLNLKKGYVEIRRMHSGYACYSV